MVRSDGLVPTRNVENDDAVRRAAAIDPGDASDQPDQEDEG
jgi:hypothetical protein